MNPENSGQEKQTESTSAERISEMRARVDSSVARIRELTKSTEEIVEQSASSAEKTELINEREIYILKSTARTKAYKFFESEPDLITRNGLINKRIEEINKMNIVPDGRIPNLSDNEIRISDFKIKYEIET